MKEAGKLYLKITLGEVLSDICTKSEVLELDPNKAPSQAVLSSSTERLCQIINTVWKTIQDSADSCPREIKNVLRTLMANVHDDGLKYRVARSD